jgi:type I restriction enzyme S subunit
LGVAKILDIKCCANDGIAALLDFNPAISTTYLVHYINTRTQYLRDVVATGNGQPNLNTELIGNFKVPFPPTLAEQQAIAGALSDADAWIESLEQLIAKKRQIKQGTMQELLTGKRRLPGFSGKWKAKRLGELGSFYSGGTPNTSIPEYYGGDIAWITSSDCNSGCIRSVAGRLTPAGVANSATKWVVPGTVLMALYGATAGVVAISKIDATINQAVLAMKLDSQDSSFMFQKLSMMKDWIIQTYTQGGQPNLSGAIVKSVELESPAYDEQVAIATVLSEMDTEIESLESKLGKAREIKQGMMQELLTGKIRLV